MFRGLAFVGPESETALRAALAAGHQNRLWNFVHLVYENQGAENSGWVTDGFIRSVAGGIAGVDVTRLVTDAQSTSVTDAIAAAQQPRDERRRQQHAVVPRRAHGRGSDGARRPLARSGGVPPHARPTPERMSEARLRVAIGSLALVGVALASYLLYVRWAGATLACTTGGCETVQASSYSKLLGVPVALLGLVAYVTIFATSLFRHDLARAAGFSIALAGVRRTFSTCNSP